MYFNRLIIVIALSLLITGIYAQPGNNNSKPDLKKDIKAISDLFRKKKKDSTVNSTPAGPAAPSAITPPGAGTGGGNGYTIIARPGGLAPGAKAIDAERIYPFNAGAAEIIKGSASGLIDSSGNFIVPYNKVDIMFIYVAGPVGNTVKYNGIYQYREIGGGWGGYINSKGKIIMKLGANGVVTDYTDNKLYIRSNNSSPKGVSYTYYSADGHIYNLPVLMENIVDGIGIVNVLNNNIHYKFAYRKLTGETIGGLYDDATPFSDGMARVGLKDDYGVLKYGYINTQGKLVIPCMFTEAPGDFSGGFARVQPKDKSAFEYAFINKKGEVTFKQTLDDIRKYGKFDHFTNFGFAFSDKYILDTSFALTSNADFFKSLGLPADSWFMGAGSYTLGESNPKLVFATRLIRGQYTQMPVYGFINLTTKKIVMPVFDFINTNGLYFDPVSHLAYAKVCTGRDKNNVPMYREGYINEDGMFVLVKGEGSTW